MKRIGSNIYIHIRYINQLPPKERELIQKAKHFLRDNFTWNIVMVNSKESLVKFLYYPRFDIDPHPSLKHSLKVDLKNGKAYLYIEKSSNPPILHRKELFVEKDYPLYEEFKKLTEQEVHAGLYNNTYTNKIGRKKFWEKLLREKGLKIIAHNLISVKESPSSESALENSFKASASTAISRTKPSFPLRLALRKKLIHGRAFDWGCGKGQDILFLRKLGFECEGWDPYYKKDTSPEIFPKGYFHWVQCIYVLNTIPSQSVREQIISKIFEFLPSGGHLYIAVREFSEIEKQAKKNKWSKYLDGWITKRGTFQKGFKFEELYLLLKKFNFKDIMLINKKPLIILSTKP